MPLVGVVMGSKSDTEALQPALEILTRFDFKNVPTEINFDRKHKLIRIQSGDEWKVKAITEILIGQCVRLKVDPKCLDTGEIEDTAQGTASMDIRIKQGIPRETAQKMVKLIKGLKIKVQPAIQEEHVRLTGKNIDDLQEIMQLLREQDYDIPLQFVNMKR